MTGSDENELTVGLQLCEGPTNCPLKSSPHGAPHAFPVTFQIRALSHIIIRKKPTGGDVCVNPWQAWQPS